MEGKLRQGYAYAYAAIGRQTCSIPHHNKITDIGRRGETENENNKVKGKK
jgi:hypothetical protein